MEKVIGLSLVLYNPIYINNFFEIGFKTIINNFKQAQKDSKKIKFIFLISTKKKEKEIIEKKILSLIKNIEIHFHFIENTTNKYSSITKAQLLHIELCEFLKINYLIYLYGDMIYSNKTFSNSIKILLKNKQIQVVCTFGLLLNKKNKHFKNFFRKLIDKKQNYLKYLIKNKSLIASYHEKFEINNLRSDKSFIYRIDNSSVAIKSFHLHPVIINLEKFNFRKVRTIKNITTLDHEFLDKFFSYKQIYVENKLDKINLFSYDFNNRENLNDKYSINAKKLITSDKEDVNIMLLKISYSKQSKLEQKLFINNIMYFGQKKILNHYVFNYFSKSNFNFFSKSNLNQTKHNSLDHVVIPSFPKIKINFINFIYFVIAITTIFKRNFSKVVNFEEKNFFFLFNFLKPKNILGNYHSNIIFVKIYLILNFIFGKFKIKDLTFKINRK